MPPETTVKVIQAEPPSSGGRDNSFLCDSMDVQSRLSRVAAEGGLR